MKSFKKKPPGPPIDWEKLKSKDGEPQPKSVNYHILGQIITRLGTVKKHYPSIDLSYFDPNNPEDVALLTKMFIALRLRDPEKFDMDIIRLPLAYYSTVAEPPLDEYLHIYPTLGMAMPDSWQRFFGLIGEQLFGKDFAEGIDFESIVEEPNQYKATGVI